MSLAVLEQRTQQIGRILFDRIGRGPRIWQRAWWDDQAMALTSADPITKIQLFRFIDALPTLRSDASVRRHLTEYLDEAGPSVPLLLSLPVRLAPPGRLGDRLIARLARWSATRMARRFIAGANPAEALQTVLELRRRRLAFTADLLGEAVISDREADVYQHTCIELLNGLAPVLARQPTIPLIDHDHLGPIPRANLSLKLTSLCARFDPIHADSTRREVAHRLRPILRRARELDAYVHIDMEQYAFKDLSLSIFRDLLSEPEFRDWPHVGIVVQSYLPDALDDLNQLRDWVQRRGTPITIRLVKGAYWDYEVTVARQHGWPVPVFQQKWQSDLQFERGTQFLMRHHRWLQPALGSHNLRSLAHAIAAAEQAGVPTSGFECQVLAGMGEPIADALAELGIRCRVYTPYGAMLPGMAYLVRRLLENTSNESFLLASAGDRPIAELLRNPEEIGMSRAATRIRPAPAGPLPPFRNEPPTDFARAANRDAFQAALVDVRSRLGLDCPLLIDGRPVPTPQTLESRDPSDTSRLVARAACATADHARAALQAAHAAFPAWADTPPAERAAILLRTAARLRHCKHELAAWEVYECAKPWREADADIAEAIDFCEFYAREMLRLAAPQHRDVPGESNTLGYLPRGVAVVIPPWNFPLAIPCGMTVAALVTGNTVVLKPAEQAPAMAWHLTQILHEAGLPPGVLNYLPGIGEEVGPTLVHDPRVALIAFTGSRDVGLLINAQAAQTPPGQDHVKRVIAEMGGKNAIIVDDDADLDEATLGVLHSAFGYAGQKCSACSRAIVLDDVYDSFLLRLTEAAQALPVGPAEDPNTAIPPVIDAEAKDRILTYQQTASTAGRIVFRGQTGPHASRGHYVPPLIVADVDPASPLAQEEIFGPVLAVIRARDLDDAIRIANSTRYALTAGLYSRSPNHIDRFRRRTLAGNLYINRPITGALVNRQPFGGFKLSGIGTKAGGPDYLREFLIPQTISENTMRRGFAPEVDITAPETQPATVA
ncbi:MAG: L-glutamate gamma-semialdehyde dehydrogenase [Isosphaeraceae bacterium]|jgi:RHH-type proline utilization regulon transcriptional repressor/proline dehydrogenase/delta 1-pyrroline-5-carboxylate dehydrogenase|nr:MAG: L-glutamate gamma-semialdehyde dehydrogenase [Isosphaeraceae bacterium]